MTKTLMTASPSVQWLYIALVACLIGAVVYVVSRGSKASGLQASDQSIGPKGVRGWLIVPVAGFVLIILRTMDMQLFSISEYFDIFQIEDSSFNIFKLLTVISIFISAFIVFSAAKCLFLIYKRKIYIKKWAFIHYPFLAAAIIFDYFVALYVQKNINHDFNTQEYSRPILGAIVGAVLWVSYFRFSKRVKNTFVEL